LLLTATFGHGVTGPPAIIGSSVDEREGKQFLADYEEQDRAICIGSVEKLAEMSPLNGDAVSKWVKACLWFEDLSSAI
jgi:hypothetical protein